MIIKWVIIQKNKATQKYAKKHLKRIPLDVQLDEFEHLKTVALENGYTVNGFIKESFREKIKKIEQTSRNMCTHIV